jgi:hypothetical protein
MRHQPVVRYPPTRAGLGQNDPFGNFISPKNGPGTGKTLQKAAGPGFIVLRNDVPCKLKIVNPQKNRRMDIRHMIRE